LDDSVVPFCADIRAGRYFSRAAMCVLCPAALHRPSHSLCAVRCVVLVAWVARAEVCTCAVRSRYFIYTSSIEPATVLAALSYSTHLFLVNCQI